MARLAPVSPDVVWFRGSDGLKFLNDILSQELADMGEGEVRRSMLLTPDGKVDHLLWVRRDAEGFGLVTDPGRGTDLATTLGRFKIRVDVEIIPEDRPVWLVVGEWDGIDVSWQGMRRALVIGERPDLPEMSNEEYQAMRISEGEPVHGFDYDDSTIPQETGLVGSTVDFGKGCFLGQELVGRIDARGGNAPRPLRLLEITGEASIGDPISHDGAEVGRLTSVADGRGLGIVKRRIEAGSEVSVGAASAIVRDLPSKPQT